MITTLCHSAQINRDGPFGDRFWYWNGKSGRRYIHSVFRPEDCPPLPGAIYLGVCRHGPDHREVLVIGRFDADLPGWAGAQPAALTENDQIDENHDQLLAETDAEVTRAMADLAAVLLPKPKRSSFRFTDDRQGQLAKWFPSLRGMFHGLGQASAGH